MSITDNKITTWNNPIVNEADRPQRSASDMKAIFDSNSNQLRTALNNLIDALAQGGASDIGAAVEGMEGQTVEAILAEMKRILDTLQESHEDLDEAYQSFTADLATAGGAEMVGAEVEGMEGGNVAAVLMELKALCDRIITNSDGKLFLANDGTYRLPSVGAAANGLPAGGAVGDIFVKKSLTVYDGEWRSPANLGFMMASTYDPDGDGIIDNAASAEEAENAKTADEAEDSKMLGGKLPSAYQEAGDYAAPAILRTVTLGVAAWTGAEAPFTQTVTASGVLADTTKQAIHVSPAPGYGTMYGSAGIECTVQAANSLTFSCEAAPESDITVNIVIQEAKV